MPPIDRTPRPVMIRNAYGDVLPATALGPQHPRGWCDLCEEPFVKPRHDFRVQWVTTGGDPVPFPVEDVTDVDEPKDWCNAHRRGIEGCGPECGPDLLAAPPSEDLPAVNDPKES